MAQVSDIEKDMSEHDVDPQQNSLLNGQIIVSDGLVVKLPDIQL